MKNKRIPPMELLKEYSNMFPHIWEHVEKLHAMNGSFEGGNWNEQCYVPIAGALMVLEECSYNIPLKNVPSEETKDREAFSTVLHAAAIAALAPWRQFKEIYSFSPELQDTLFSQVDEDIEIPIQVLDLLPFPCVYIELKPSLLLDDLIPDLVGFFVHFEHDIMRNRKELRFLGIDSNGGTGQLMIHLRDGYTLKEAIDSVIDESRENSRSISANQHEIEKIEAPWHRLVSALLQLVLYICCQNAEIKENPEQKKMYKKTDRIKDQYKEVRKWDVGEDFSRKIKHAKEQNRDSKKSSGNHTGQRSRPRPHARRGHWHHFWTGSKKSDARKSVLRWVAPTYVNTSNKEEVAGRVIEFHE